MYFKKIYAENKRSLLLIIDRVLKINTSSTRKELYSPILRLISLLSFLVSENIKVQRYKINLLVLTCMSFRIVGNLLGNDGQTFQK